MGNRIDEEEFDEVLERRRRKRSGFRTELIFVAAFVALVFGVFVVGGGVILWNVLRKGQNNQVASAPSQPAVRQPRPELPARQISPAPPLVKPKLVEPDPPASPAEQMPTLPDVIPNPPKGVIDADVPKQNAPRTNPPPSTGGLDKDGFPVVPKPKPPSASPSAEGAAQGGFTDEEFVIAPTTLVRPKREGISGYYTLMIGSWKVLISKLAWDESDMQGGMPLGYLQSELSRIESLLPPDTIRQLSGAAIWVEWDHTIPEVLKNGDLKDKKSFRTTVLGAYYGGVGETLALQGVDPRKEKSVCLLSLKSAHSMCADGSLKKLVILHELAHAVHDQILGSDNPYVANAFEQAQARKTYDKVRHSDLTIRPAYASKSEAEYFAELTCAYLDRLNYSPLNRAELKALDSVGYELMTKVWGTPDQIQLRKAAFKKKKK